MKVSEGIKASSPNNFIRNKTKASDTWGNIFQMHLTETSVKSVEGCKELWRETQRRMKNAWNQFFVLFFKSSAGVAVAPEARKQGCEVGATFKWIKYVKGTSLNWKEKCFSLYENRHSRVLISYMLPEIYQRFQLNHLTKLMSASGLN